MRESEIESEKRKKDSKSMTYHGPVVFKVMKTPRVQNEKSFLPILSPLALWSDKVRKFTTTMQGMRRERLASE